MGFCLRLPARPRMLSILTAESLLSDPITRLNEALEGRYVIERELGEGYGEVVVTGGASKPRERVKVVSRDAMTAISRSTEVPEDLIGQPETGRVPERVAYRL